MDGKKIRAIRSRFGLTQVGLAKLLGVTPTSLARWERGEMAVGKRVELHLQLLVESGTLTGAARTTKHGVHTKTTR
jgi:DNA-binding transcriptional regulator YiaG